jgi:hypothetical protein
VNEQVPENLAIYSTGWVDIGTRTKVPLGFVTFLSKITKINEKVF